MVVIIEEEVREVSSAMVTRLIGTGIGPFASDGLDEAFGFAVSLRTVWSGEAMLNTEFTTGSGEVFGAVG